MAFTIAVLSNEWLIYFGLKTILESSTSVPMVVLPSAGTSGDLLRGKSSPDVFILDLGTDTDALGTIKQIQHSAPTSKLVLLCGFEDIAHVGEALVAGADGIILKVQPPQVVLATVEALYASTHASAITHQAAARNFDLKPPLLEKVESDFSLPSWPDGLTEREREVVCLLTQGLSNKEIAYRLSISDSTVRHHMTSIFDKVGVPNRQKLLLHIHLPLPGFPKPRIY